MKLVEARAKAWVKVVIIYAALLAAWVFVLIALRDTNVEFWTILVSGSCTASLFLGLWIVKMGTDRLMDEVTADKMRRQSSVEHKEAKPKSPHRRRPRARHH